MLGGVFSHGLVEDACPYYVAADWCDGESVAIWADTEELGTAIRRLLQVDQAAHRQSIRNVTQNR